MGFLGHVGPHAQANGIARQGQTLPEAVWNQRQGFEEVAASRPAPEPIAPHLNLVFPGPAGRQTLSLPRPKSLQIDSCGGEHGDFFAFGSQGLTQPRKIRLGTAQGRWVTLYKM